ncbi:uncharacterized protein PRCAT00002911001 [Priceomyces carsonii]|uniref:uncharacterized protein n=1 Tax=Priceomyces carsonii TaxID=28549 RepID=UPI002ED99262|nr:unnamed protein product [Priceomyces carsonii]
MSADELDLGLNGLFDEPDDFLPPPPEPHFATYKRKQDKDPKDITLRLVGKSPLWGHLLWNAGIFTADYLDRHAETLVKGKRVLELGAAAALPSVLCALNEAELVVATDYPDPDLIQNIEYNFAEHKELNNYEVKGLIWGNNVQELFIDELSEENKFDLIILSDLIFNHTEHLKLLKNCRELLKKDGKCLVVFSPHRPLLLHKDLEFFKTCEQFEFKGEPIDLVVWNPMFEEDDETIEIRSRVYSFFLIPQWK